MKYIYISLKLIAVFKMNSIDFNTFDYNFCKATIYSNRQYPKYLNSISSLFISFIGLYGLTNSYNSFHTRMLFFLLFINGITSLYYHYYNTIVWTYWMELLDKISMLLIAMVSIHNCTINIKIKYYHYIIYFHLITSEIIKIYQHILYQMNSFLFVIFVIFVIFIIFVIFNKFKIYFIKIK